MALLVIKAFILQAYSGAYPGGNFGGQPSQFQGAYNPYFTPDQQQFGFGGPYNHQPYGMAGGYPTNYNFAMGVPPGGPQGTMPQRQPTSTMNTIDQSGQSQSSNFVNSGQSMVEPGRDSSDSNLLVNQVPSQTPSASATDRPRGSHYIVAPNKLNQTYSVSQSDNPMPGFNWLGFGEFSVEPGCVDYSFIDTEIDKYERKEIDIFELLSQVLKESAFDDDDDQYDLSHDSKDCKLEGYEKATKGRSKSDSFMQPNPEIRKMWLDNRDLLKGTKDYGKKAASKTVSHFNKHPSAFMFKDLQPPDKELKGGDKEKEGIFCKIQNQIGAAAHANLHGIRHLKLLNKKISEFLNIEQQFQGDGSAHTFEETMNFLDQIRMVLDAMCSRRFGNVSRIIADQFNKLTEERRKLYVNVCPSLKDANVPPSEGELFGSIALTMLKEKRDDSKSLGFTQNTTSNSAGRGRGRGNNSYNYNNPGGYQTRFSKKSFGHNHGNQGNDRKPGGGNSNWRNNVKDSGQSDGSKKSDQNSQPFQGGGGRGGKGKNKK